MAYETPEEFVLNGKLYVDDLQSVKKERYRVGDVAKLLEINERTYRTWEERGWFPKARRDPQSGYRVFDEEELMELKTLFEARARRFKGKEGAR